MEKSINECIVIKYEIISVFIAISIDSVFFTGVIPDYTVRFCCLSSVFLESQIEFWNIRIYTMPFLYYNEWEQTFHISERI
ncbi:MAG: hypothetical protein LIO93_07520 [Bacteroidales bacterium]|nr:hypothetical protein [Bacteroidales bacterium]